MKRIEIKNKEYNLVTLGEDLALYTVNLNEDIAYTICSIQLKKVGLARSLNQAELVKFFAEINPNNVKTPGLIKLGIVGGTESQTSKDRLNELLLNLQSIDNNDNIIDIRSCDACERMHPDSFELDCYHGGIHGIAV